MGSPLFGTTKETLNCMCGLINKTVGRGGQAAGMIFIARFMDSFMYQTSLTTGDWRYDRHR